MDDNGEQPASPVTSPRAAASQRLHIATFLACTAVVAVATWALAHHHWQTALGHWEMRLGGLAGERRDRVLDWLAERRADARVLAGNPALQRLLSEPGAPAGDFASYLDALVTAYRYVGIYVLDPAGHLVVHSRGAPLPKPASSREAAESTERVRVQAIGRAPQRSLLSFGAPVRAQAQNDAPLLGRVELMVDSDLALSPLMNPEPWATSSAETLLVRRDGEEVEFMHRLRHDLRGATVLRLPFRVAPLALAALQDREIFGEFLDYRGETVLAAAQSLPDIGWGVVAKIDRAEALAAVRNVVMLQATAAGLLIGCVAGLLRVHWQRHRAQALVQELEQQRALRESEAKFRTLLEWAPDAVLIANNHDHRIGFVNAHAEQLFGYRRDELLGQAIEILVPQRFRARHARLRIDYAAAPRQRAMGTSQIWARRSDGSEFLADIMLGPMMIDGSLSVLTIIRDITERSRVEREQQRLIAILEATTDFIATADVDSRILYINRAGRKLLGLGPDEDISGRRIQDTHPQWASDLVEKTGLPTAAREGAWHGETAIIAADGRHVPVSQVILAHRSPAGVEYFSTIARDLTERKQAEQALRTQAEELAHSNAELQQFAYVASHDLQEPLRTITSYTQLLERRYKNRFDADANEFTGFVVDAAQRMSALLDAILAFSRIGTHAQSLVPVDSAQVMRATLEDLHAVISQSGAEITCDSLPPVHADPTQLRQLFQNLIGNAIKFQSNGTLAQIHVSARRPDAARPTSDQMLGAAARSAPLDAQQRSGAPNPQAMVLFSVSDNGIGIAPQYHERIFRVFQRLHTSAEYPGTGIGLALCKKIVERHGGRIWVESTPGHGSTFFFTLPAQL